MRVAIMGAGSMGTILGAYIAKAGRQIDLIDVNKEHVDALNKKGATIIGTVNFNVPIKALTPDQMEGTYDLVFYMTKQTYNETALKQLLPHLHKDTVVCTTQNGLPEPAVAEVIGENAFIFGVGYTSDAFFASAYYVDCGDLAIDNDGFAVNFGYTGIENLILYLNYEDNDTEESSQIIGAKYTYDAFWAMAEIQLNDDYAEDNYGIRLNYTFGNKIYAQYRWVTAAGDDTTNELRLGVAF
jgi:hypothetical protein